MTTSSVDAAHGAFDIVQRKVYDVPAVPVKVEVGLDGVPIVPPVPLIIVQLPVPIVGALPASVTDVCPHVAALVWSGPALAVVGFWLKVMTTSSVDELQGGLEIVQRNVYVVPAVPLNIDVGLEGVTIEPPAPLIILQLPVPIVGVLPASVTDVSPQVAVPV